MPTLTLRETPRWYQEFRRLFLAGVAHCYVITGDIHGVTAQGATQQDFLRGALGTREVVACYHPATGITFPLPSMRAAALDMLGPDWQPPRADEYTAALDAAGMTSSPDDPFEAARKPAQALAILDQLLHSPQAACTIQTPKSPMTQGLIAVIIDQADLVLPATGKAQMSDARLAVLATLLSWGHDPVLTRQQNPVLLLTPQGADLHPDLLHRTSGYRLIEQPLPDEPTRLAYLNWYLDEHRAPDDPLPLVDLTREDLARNTAGLNLREVEDVLLAGDSQDEQESERGRRGVTRLHAKERKDAIIRQQYHDTVEMLEPLPGGFADLGGMRQFIAWFRTEVIAPLRAGRLGEVPKGILLVGPPGNGKTLLVQAAARELGFHALAVLMANILGGIVGTSEHNLQEIFRLARGLAPTFLFLDEIDQTQFSNRGASGSPVAANLFGAMLQFLGDERLRGQVIVVAATNHPELLDPALLRAGRFDVVFPILCPDATDRPEVLAVQARVQGTRLEQEALALLTKETERYSAADLAALVKEAKLLARLADQPSIGPVHARAALDNLRPTTLSTVDAFTQAAIAACNNLRYLPEHLAERERARLLAARQAAAHATQDPPLLPTARRGARTL